MMAVYLCVYACVSVTALEDPWTLRYLVMIKGEEEGEGGEGGKQILIEAPCTSADGCFMLTRWWWWVVVVVLEGSLSVCMCLCSCVCVIIFDGVVRRRTNT